MQADAADVRGEQRRRDEDDVCPGEPGGEYRALGGGRGRDKRGQDVAHHNYFKEDSS